MKKTTKKAPAKKTTAKKSPKVVKKIALDESSLTLPPKSNVNLDTMYVAQPNPLNSIYYNCDQAYQNDPQNTIRMWNDLSIYSAITERKLATAELNFQIVPTNEDNPEEQAAAEHIQRIIERIKDLQQLCNCLLDAIFWGKAGATVVYDYEFKYGQQELGVVDWAPIHGDTILFGNDGKIGYKVGSSKLPIGDIEVSVQGRFKEVTEEDREAWIIHGYAKQAGEFHDQRTASSRFGVGLRSSLFATWYTKQTLMANLVANAEKFGSGYLVGYFELGNPASQEAVSSSMQKQVGQSIQIFPRQVGTDAAEGVEVINPPNGVSGMLESISYYDKQIRQAICGETLTSEAGSTGLGSNLADVHKDTFLARVRFDAKCLQDTLTRDFVSILQKYNGYEHLPPLRWEFAFDDSIEKLEKAKILADMHIPLSDSELYQISGFTAPSKGEEQTAIDEEPQTIEEIMTEASNT